MNCIYNFFSSLGPGWINGATVVGAIAGILLSIFAIWFSKRLNDESAAVSGSIQANTDAIQKQTEAIQRQTEIIYKHTEAIHKHTKVLRLDKLRTVDDNHKEKITSLGEEKTRLTVRLTEIDHRKERASNSKKAVTELEDRIVEFKAGWTKGTFAQKKRLIRAIIDRLEVSPGLLGLFYLVPQDEEAQGPKAPVLRPDFDATNSTPTAGEVQNKKAAGNSVIPAALGSSIDLNGVQISKHRFGFYLPEIVNRFEHPANPALSQRKLPPAKVRG
jgi:hypothetical protein